MPRVYTVVAAAVTIPASGTPDLFELTAADDHPIEIIGVDLGQTSSTTQENIGVSIVRGNSAAGSGGAAVTPAPLDPGDAAASFTAAANNSTAASSGTAVTLATWAWNLLAGYINWWHDPATRFRTHQGANKLCVRLTAPAGTRTGRCTVYVLEH
ncbi:MAG: hypothetical protein KA265_17080 [Piscinibacter sp.]|nr:hypothetical protein [Piscinibacter sp.]